MRGGGLADTVGVVIDQDSQLLDARHGGIFLIPLLDPAAQAGCNGAPR